MSVLGLIEVMFVVFVRSGFRSPFSSLLLFQHSIYGYVCFAVIFH